MKYWLFSRRAKAVLDWGLLSPAANRQKCLHSIILFMYRVERCRTEILYYSSRRPKFFQFKLWQFGNSESGQSVKSFWNVSDFPEGTPTHFQGRFQTCINIQYCFFQKKRSPVFKCLIVKTTILNLRIWEFSTLIFNHLLTAKAPSWKLHFKMSSCRVEIPLLFLS